MKTRFNKSLYAFLFCCLFLFSSSFLTHKWNDECHGNIITWDIAGYYFYLPTVFYDHLWHPDKIDYIVKTYNPMPGNAFYAGEFLPNGHYVMKYTCGMAIVYLPGFAMGHIMAKIQGYPVDGFSQPYQFWMAMWSIFVACIGLWVMRKVLLKYFSDLAVSLSLIVLCIATNFFPYVSFQGLMPHAYLFTLFALVIYCSEKWYQKPGYVYSMVLGVLCGVASLIRPTNVICVLIPLLWGIVSLNDVTNRLKVFIVHFPKVLLFVISALCVGSIQLLYWKHFAGHYLFWSYGQDESFSFLHPHIINGLISCKKGWLMYTPVMVLSLIGFIPLYRTHKNLFLWALIFTCINLYIVFSWNEWWYGGTFSQRSLIESYTILLFPLTALFSHALKRISISIPVVLFLIFCTWLNFLMTWQAYVKGGFMETENMTKAYYWRIFGRTSISLNDRKLLDTDEEMPRQYEKDLKVIYTNDFEHSAFADSTIPASTGHKALLLNKDKQLIPEIKVDISRLKSGWIRAYAKVFPTDKEWTIWRMAQFTLVLYNSDKPVKDKEIRIYHIAEPGKWQEIFVDIRIQEGENVNTLGVKFWNADGDKTMYIDDLRVEAAID